jgi:predicted ATP-dependent endonuclease of OLD family
MGEFSEVIPLVQFDLPDEEVIAKEMRIILDDGYPSEIEQKGHGLQRATLLAMLRVLAKHGLRYQERPTPMFLIGEIETFLHPYAQKLLAEAFDSLIDRYQIITSTHSPFIVSPRTITGYRRVRKNATQGTKNIILKDPKSINMDLIKRHLERRGNLEGLFADRIILIEGDHDEGFYDRLKCIFKIPFPSNKFTLFIKGGGKEELRQARKFYLQMGFDDVSIICDVDYLFSNDIIHLFQELGLDKKIQDGFRKHIDWTGSGDPALDVVVEILKKKGEPKDFDKIVSELAKHRIFVLRKGSPEVYFKNSVGKKSAWEELKSEDDLIDPEYLKNLMLQVLS